MIFVNSFTKSLKYFSKNYVTLLMYENVLKKDAVFSGLSPKILHGIKLR